MALPELRRLPASLWLSLAAAAMGCVALAAVALWGIGARQLTAVRICVLLLALASLCLMLFVARLRAREAARTRELSELATHLQELGEREKTELARHLHDELGGLLTAAKMDLSWLQGHRADPPTVQQRLQQLGGALDEAMDVKRRAVEELRPSLLDHFGLPTALRAYVETACQKAGLACVLEIAEDGTYPRELAIALFRIAQEGLANTIRHAHARSVRLKLAHARGRCILELADDGVGIDLTDERFYWSHGLAGMRQRALTFGARFTLDSAPGRGTLLRIELPGSDSAGAR